MFDSSWDGWHDRRRSGSTASGYCHRSSSAARRARNRSVPTEGTGSPTGGIPSEVKSRRGPGTRRRQRPGLPDTYSEPKIVKELGDNS